MTFNKKEIKAPSLKSYPRTLVDNALIASYRGEQPDTCSFALFPKLPTEIRIKIWRFAISVPRIVEVIFNDHWQCKNTNPPPLLSTCAESRHESLKAYSTIAGPEWIRCDWDVLCLKHLDFHDNKGFDRRRFQGSIQRWDPQDEDISAGSDKWIGRPQSFEMISALAINREVLTQTWDDYEYIIRHFFPSLKLLVVLVDDAIAIEHVWDIKSNDFKAYEGD
jgi:hypothetical protein